MSARDEALRIGVQLGWLCLPLRYSSRTSKWICPHKYGELGIAAFALELWEQLWDGHEDAPGMGALWPSDVVQVEADTNDGEEWIRKRKPPRTPTFSSRRGPHYLFHGDGANINARPSDGVEVLSRESGKRMLILPPTPPKSWFPALTPWDVDLVPLPSAFALRASSNGARRTAIVLGPDLPPGQAHLEMARIVGKLAPNLSRGAHGA